MSKLQGKYIEDKAITLAKMNDLAQNTIIGRVTASTGVPEALTAENVRSIINVADGANNYSLPTATTEILGGVKVDGTTITITNGVISGAAGDSETKKVEILTLDETDISNAYKDLAEVPTTATAVEVTPVGGIPQQYTVDFTVITNGTVIKRLNWDGLGLDGVLEATDKLIVSYTY